MPDQQIEKREAGVFGVLGDLSFESVIWVEKEGLDVIKQTDGQMTFDLSSVGHCSSASLALLLSWTRAARTLDKPLKYTGIPPLLARQIQSAHLQSILPIQASLECD